MTLFWGPLLISAGTKVILLGYFINPGSTLITVEFTSETVSTAKPFELNRGGTGTVLRWRSTLCEISSTRPSWTADQGAGVVFKRMKDDRSP